jgi:hypothetical protein
VPADKSDQILARNPSVSALDEHPQLRAYVKCFLDTFIVHGRIDPRIRELLILRIAWRCGQAYEWAQHYRRARDVDVSDDDILLMRSSDPGEIADSDLALLIQGVDEVVDVGSMGAETYRLCQTYFGDGATAYEYLHLVAGYRMMATVLNTTKPSLTAAGLAAWPPDGRGPT